MGGIGSVTMQCKRGLPPSLTFPLRCRFTIASVPTPTIHVVVFLERLNAPAE